MEYISNISLEQISATLTNFKLGSYILNGKCSAFVSRYPVSKRHRSNKNSEVSSYFSTGFLPDNIQEQKSVTDESTKQPLPLATILDFPPPKRERSCSFGITHIRKPTRKRTSSLGDLTEPSTRALLLDFVTALNETFPDYDFGESKLEQFKDKDVEYVMANVNNYLAEVTARDGSMLDRLWTAIDEIVNLKQCEVFSFQTDNTDDDAYANIWEFHYFFFNKDLHSLCYLNCAAQSIFRKDYQIEDEEDSEYDEDEDIENDEDIAMDDEIEMSRNNIDINDAFDEDAESNNGDVDEDCDGKIPEWDGII